MIKGKTESIVYGMFCAVVLAAPWLLFKTTPRMFDAVGPIFIAFMTVVTLVVPSMNLKKPFLHRIHPSIYGFFFAGYILAFFVIPFKITRGLTYRVWQHYAYGWGFAFLVIAAFLVAISFLKNKNKE